MFDTINQFECQCGGYNRELCMIHEHRSYFISKTPTQWKIELDGSYWRGFYDGRKAELENRVRFATPTEHEEFAKRLKEIGDSLGTPKDLLEKLRKEIEI